MINFLATFKKNNQTNRRAYPLTTVMGEVVMGVAFILFPLFTYYYLFQGNVSDSFVEATGGSDYVTFITKGVSISILSIATLFNCSRAFIIEIWEGTLDPFLMSPAPRIPYYFGVFAEQLSRSLIGFTVTLLVGIAFGARFPIGSLHNYVVILGLVLIANFSLAVSISTIMVYTRNTYITQNTIFSAMYFICGMIFPVSFLPMPLQYLSQIFPLTPALTLIRAASLPHFFLGEYATYIIQLCVLSIIYFFVGYLLFRKHEKKLIENVLS